MVQAADGADTPRDDIVDSQDEDTTEVAVPEPPSPARDADNDACKPESIPRPRSIRDSSRETSVQPVSRTALTSSCQDLSLAGFHMPGAKARDVDEVTKPSMILDDRPVAAVTASDNSDRERLPDLTDDVNKDDSLFNADADDDNDDGDNEDDNDDDADTDDDNKEETDTTDPVAARDIDDVDDANEMLGGVPAHDVDDTTDADNDTDNDDDDDESDRLLKDADDEMDTL
ncbi:MAG: hypothetical protein GY714_00110, partial [Desulfobacterales bacterium]|nr:hypothetical protein [Desulfobacterales bacterium]